MAAAVAALGADVEDVPTTGARRTSGRRLAGHARPAARPRRDRLRAGRHRHAVPAAGGGAGGRRGPVRRRPAGPRPPDGPGGRRAARPRGRGRRRRHRSPAVHGARHGPGRAAGRSGSTRRRRASSSRPAARRGPVRRGARRRARRAADPQRAARRHDGRGAARRRRRRRRRRAALWRVEPGPVGALDVQVEPDLSNAAPFLAAAAVTGGRVTVPGWPQHTTQAGDALRDLLDPMGADVSLDRDGLTVRARASSTASTPTSHDAGELTPVVAALAALADSPSHLRGIAHLRGHETDRLAALAHEINALGGDVAETDDGLRHPPEAVARRGVRAPTTTTGWRPPGALLGLRRAGRRWSRTSRPPPRPCRGSPASGHGRSRRGRAPVSPSPAARPRRVRRPHPAQPARLPAADQGAAAARGRRRRARCSRSTAAGTPARRRVDRDTGDAPQRNAQRDDPLQAPGQHGVAMKARELGRKGVVVGDRVALVGDVPARPGRLARIVRRRGPRLAAAAQRRRHRPGRAGRRRERRPARRRHARWPTRSPPADDRPLPGRGVRRRAGRRCWCSPRPT